MISTVALALALAAPSQGPTERPAPPRDAWFGADKLKHFFVAAFVQSVAYSALQGSGVRHDRAIAGAWAVTATASVAKELNDKRTGGIFSVRDLVWDAAGAGAATALLVWSQRRKSSDEAQGGVAGSVARSAVAVSRDRHTPDRVGGPRTRWSGALPYGHGSP